MVALGLGELLALAEELTQLGGRRVALAEAVHRRASEVGRHTSSETKPFSPSTTIKDMTSRSKFFSNYV